MATRPTLLPTDVARLSAPSALRLRPLLPAPVSSSSSDEDVDEEQDADASERTVAAIVAGSLRSIMAGTRPTVDISMVVAVPSATCPTNDERDAGALVALSATPLRTNMGHTARYRGSVVEAHPNGALAAGWTPSNVPLLPPPPPLAAREHSLPQAAGVSAGGV